MQKLHSESTPILQQRLRSHRPLRRLKITKQPEQDGIPPKAPRAFHHENHAAAPTTESIGRK
ncbi:hypothetical protein DPMN_025083 [Dreissena polymorpha]|uniref:Uncharacterized protein n=1 Tax=Dreissena polymorpha TaxID=45954 RepID=A0A9D4LQ41_DREPO|nr:hypothetical protein DPMN_025083 [Dreissena polymorpha]